MGRYVQNCHLPRGLEVMHFEASFLLFLYTLAGSLFMLLAIMVILYNRGSTDFTVVSLSEVSQGDFHFLSRPILS
jgi:NADH:ubiquinone oxidoreductase subunit 4 (subunit M)